MRRRKPRVVWLPQTNANGIGDLTTVYQLRVFQAGGVTGSSTTIELPCVGDAQQSFLDANNPSLADIESSGYRLRRIVGKIWIQLAQQDPSQVLQVVTQSFIVTAGFMVRKADQASGTSLGALVSAANVDPGLIDNTGDPWIWRRSWTLHSNYADGNYLNPSAGLFQIINPGPYNNYNSLAGGVADGPHIDQKTARIVGPEERLFLNVTATVLSQSTNPALESPSTLAMWTDLRILGSLRTSSGNRGNSTR